MEKPTKRAKQDVTIMREKYFKRDGGDLGVSTETLVWMIYPDVTDPAIFATRQKLIQYAIDEMVEKLRAAGKRMRWRVSLGEVEPDRRLRSGGLYRASGCPYYVNIRVVRTPEFMPNVLRQNRNALADELVAAANAQCPVGARSEPPEPEVVPPAAEAAPQPEPTAATPEEPASDARTEVDGATRKAKKKPHDQDIAHDPDVPLDDVDGPKVFERAGKLFTDSRHVAKEFGMRHDNVLRKIEGILCENGGPLLKFEEGSYRHAKTGKQEHRLFYLDRDAFMLLVGRFEGAAALKVQMAWIAEFNRMEALLKSRALPAPELTREQRLAQALIDAQAVIGEKDQTIVKLEQASLQKDTVIEHQAPIVAYAKETIEREDDSTLTRVSTKLNIKRHVLIDLLINPPLRWLYRHSPGSPLECMKGHPDFGKYFVIKSRRFPDPANPKEMKDGESVRITEKGVAFLHAYLRKHPPEGPRPQAAPKGQGALHIN